MPITFDFSVLLKKIKENLLPILLFFGITPLTIYFSFKILTPDYFDRNYKTFQEVFDLSLAILSSGIFLAILKWFQFMGFFKTAIETIISSSEFDEKLEKTVYRTVYSDDFLKQQKDLTNLWKRVNRNLFKSEFPEELVEKIEKEMSDVFLHNSSLSHYFKNYIVKVKITLTADDFLEIEELCELRLIRPNTEKFPFDFKYFIKKTSDIDSISNITFNSIIADGKPFDLGNIENTELPDSQISKKIVLELEGRKEYEITSRISLKFNINKDFEYECFSERFVDYLRTEIQFSQNLRVIFLPLGNETFSDVSEGPGTFVKVYQSVLLPQKGFRLIFIKI